MGVIPAKAGEWRRGGSVAAADSTLRGWERPSKRTMRQDVPADQASIPRNVNPHPFRVLRTVVLGPRKEWGTRSRRTAQRPDATNRRGRIAFGMHCRHDSGTHPTRERLQFLTGQPEFSTGQRDFLTGQRELLGHQRELLGHQRELSIHQREPLGHQREPLGHQRELLTSQRELRTSQRELRTSPRELRTGQREQKRADNLGGRADLP